MDKIKLTSVRRSVGHDDLLTTPEGEHFYLECEQYLSSKYPGLCTKSAYVTAGRYWWLHTGFNPYLVYISVTATSEGLRETTSRPYLLGNFAPHVLFSVCQKIAPLPEVLRSELATLKTETANG